MSRGGKSINSVFYAERYHPIQAGSIDGTDTLPHDRGVHRALLCSNAALYDPFGDPKVIGDPYCTLFVGRLSHLTTEDTLRKAMEGYGRVKNLRLVRHIVTGASRGYAFVEFETEKEMRRAYKDAHHTFIDDSEIIVDYNRQQLMPGWIPRRLGGGLGGKKESGQLRFGGRERPFRAPLRPIPFDDLKRLGISPPPEGRYMTRFQMPSPPRRKRGSSELDEREKPSSRRHVRSRSPDQSYGGNSEDRHYSKQDSEDRHYSKQDRQSYGGNSEDRHYSKQDRHYSKQDSEDRHYSKQDRHSERHEKRRSSRHQHEYDRWTPSR